MEAGKTGAYFVPAPGLALAASFDGFESKERNIQVIAANFGAPLDDIAKGFTEESFKAMGMQLKSRGEFTVNGARAYLFKVLHPSGDTNWGKWIMLAENGKNTLEVNAVFVSGDAVAASDLEIMLKGVCMEPPRPVSVNSEDISARPASEDISIERVSADIRMGAEAPIEPATKSWDVPAVKRAVSRDVRLGSETKQAPLEKDSIKPDETTVDSVKPANDDGDNAAVPVSPDIGSGDVVSSDRKTRLRIITEEGVVSVQEASTVASGDENVSGE